jgi:hypothetical protein
MILFQNTKSLSEKIAPEVRNVCKKAVFPSDPAPEGRDIPPLWGLKGGRNLFSTNILPRWSHTNDFSDRLLVS